MKRGLLVYRVNRDDSANSGVIKKCKAQKKAFEQNDLEVDMLWLCREGVLKNEELIVERILSPHQANTYYFYFFQFGKIIFSEALKGNYDFIYLRHPFFDPLLVKSLKNIKAKFPSLKILLEINTYPYDSEPKRFLHRLSLKIDQYFRKNAAQYIDRIVNYGAQEKIWNIPTINIRNGIDLDESPLSNSDLGNVSLRLIAVGNWSYWHGLDRVLEGLLFFYLNGGKSVILSIVGGGQGIVEAKNFVENNNLKEYVKFYPPTFGKELDHLFNRADIGVGTLGLHRKKVVLDSSLKHRSYCARGIPFVLSGNDPDFPEGLDFIKYLEATDARISIKEIILFLKKIIKEKPGYKAEMRQYAEEHLTWKKKVAQIIDVIAP